ncbi:UPF0481 protein At3g47200-like [Magnolia sinica]|uniref:UPF0481 protein At3g47200-like n=1 Tax=Magnolia sinica TaxID=86752 RepID=UPI0026598398|nr:UPF0481 protein At3g47200-like [Magnolia sinica]
MDDDKMSCGQEVGMSSGEASMRSLHEIECPVSGAAIGNSSIESADLPLSCAEADVEVSCSTVSMFKTHMAVGNFFTQFVGTQSGTTSVSLPVYSPTIYKVPQRIRQANKHAFDPYKPQIVSIGPYHKEKEFEKHKQLYRDSILSRNPNHPLGDYHTAIAKLETEARSCYSEHVGLDRNEFVEMMMLDGCFIVELFLRIKEKKFEEEDPIFRTIWMLPLIRYDMLLLENQIPFFVLEIIYEMASTLGNGSLVELALDFFERIIEHKIEVSKDLINGHYFHLLHLFHSYLMPTPREKSKKCKIQMCLCSKCSSEAKLPIKNTTIKNKAKLPIRNTTIKMIPCAVELQLAGVKFKKKKDFSSFLDVKFSCGVLEIPYLCVDDCTNTLLRNLVALEQFCYPGVKTIHFTNYVGFMDCLINTSKDVALLHRKGIIDHLLGSDGHVADLFNHLCYGIFNDFEDHNYLSGIYKDVHKYYNTPCNRCWARLRSDYFTNPWAGLSSAAAVLLIVVTIFQTIYTILSYYQGPSS